MSKYERWQLNKVLFLMNEICLYLINMQIFHFDQINLFEKLESRPQNKYHHADAPW